MRFCQIRNVNVVADAGAVRRRVIRAKNRDIASSPKSCIEYQRNEMSLHCMIFTDVAARVCACSIEVSQRQVLETVLVVRPLQRVLELQFGFSVRADWMLWRIFPDRNCSGFTVSGACGREDESLHPGAFHRVQEIASS